MPTKVLLTETTQDMVEDVKALDVEDGRPKPSDAATANHLIQLGYAEFKARRQKAQKKGGRTCHALCAHVDCNAAKGGAK